MSLINHTACTTLLVFLPLKVADKNSKLRIAGGQDDNGFVDVFKEGETPASLAISSKGQCREL